MSLSLAKAHILHCVTENVAIDRAQIAGWTEYGKRAIESLICSTISEWCMDRAFKRPPRDIPASHVRKQLTEQQRANLRAGHARRKARLRSEQ